MLNSHLLIFLFLGGEKIQRFAKCPPPPQGPLLRLPKLCLCTSLIYLLAASACEFADIVELLLDAGADPSIKDMEGSLPEEVTESSAISSLLRQYTAPKG